MFFEVDDLDMFLVEPQLVLAYLVELTELTKSSQAKVSLYGWHVKHVNTTDVSTHVHVSMQIKKKNNDINPSNAASDTEFVCNGSGPWLPEHQRCQQLGMMVLH